MNIRPPLLSASQLHLDSIVIPERIWIAMIVVKPALFIVTASITCPLDCLILIRALSLNAEAAHDTWTACWELLIFGHAAESFSTITETANALHLECARPGSWEEIPD